MLSRRVISSIASPSRAAALVRPGLKAASARGTTAASFSTSRVSGKPLSAQAQPSPASIPPPGNIAALVESLTSRSKASSKITPTLEKFTLKNKVAVVTGFVSPPLFSPLAFVFLPSCFPPVRLTAGRGARGLGFNIAEALCDVDLKALVIFDVLKQHGDEAVAMLSQKYDIPIVFKQVDVRDHRGVQEAVDQVCPYPPSPPRLGADLLQVTATLGRIDVLIASAGIAEYVSPLSPHITCILTGRGASSNIPAEGYDIEMFRRLIDINLTGTFVSAQAVGNAMIKQGSGGSMVFIASMSGHIVNYPQQQSCYNASKAGVIMLGKSLAAEWASHRIRVNTISPGYMDTALNRVPQLDAQKEMWKERTPMNRLGNVDELNNLAVFLASDASTYMTGSDLLIDVCTFLPARATPSMADLLIKFRVCREGTVLGKENL